MKPLIEDFNPEMTSVYDDCLKGIPHDTYLQPASKLKQEFGSDLFSIQLILDIEMRNLMIEHDVKMISIPADF